VYPAVAILKGMETLGYSGIYIGHPEKLESRVCAQVGIKFFGVLPDYFAGFSARRLLRPIPFVRALLSSASILLRERVRFLIAVGGYVSVPAFLAAQLLRIPCIVHEQNATPGKATRLFLNFRPLFLTTFKVTADTARPSVATVHTGCPIDGQIGTIQKRDARVSLGVEPNQKVVLAVGGSGGASALNAAVLELLSFLQEEEEVVLFHVTGMAYYESVLSVAKATWPTVVRARYHILPYASPIALYYAAADVIISRSGAASINEIFAVKVPAILVPSPNVSENHQELNARILEGVGLAEVVYERDVACGVLKELLRAMLHRPATLRPAGKDHEQFADPKLATEVIVKAVDEYVSG
jgi:UDP-N-acetylglucosamine--N-acetylmuramyl-(pentapeptide) pyrophosphoryl-undecaprenol N-acetylglucosamine transferase